MESAPFSLPIIFGYAFSRSGNIVACYGSYRQTDEGMFTDGATLVSLVIMFIPFLFLAFKHDIIKKRTINRLMRVMIALQAATIILLGLDDLFNFGDFNQRFIVCVVCTIVSYATAFYWIRRMREAGSSTVAAFVFSALIIGELLISLCEMVPIFLGDFMVSVFVLLQYPCMIWARNHINPHLIPASTEEMDYFGFSAGLMGNKLFLITNAFGIGILSVAIGLLRGYPAGASIAFTPLTRSLYVIFTISLAFVLLVILLRGRKRIMTVGIIVVMTSLACTALLCYALFPSQLDIGAIFVTVLNALTVSFKDYIIIAFMSFGWRDPYYYAMAGWFVFLGFRSTARMILWVLGEQILTPDFLLALIGTLIAVSIEIVLLQYLYILNRIKRPAAAATEESQSDDQLRESVFSHIMGLDQQGALTALRQSSMRRSAETMGRQFMLSDREVDVLALYAQGFTQKRVAEELFISPSTAHAHIKRIYAKTGMHSRQELLDYIEKYAS